MTREQFFDLAQRVSGFAQQHPRRYRFTVTAFAALGYAVLFGAMGLCAAALVFGALSCMQEWFWSTVGRNVRLLLLWGGLLISFAVTLFAMVRSLFVRVPAPSGLRVERGSAPKLFAVLDEVVAASQAPGRTRCC